MAKNVSYTCDRCNHTQDTEEQMWDIGVLLRHVPTSRSMYSPQFTPQHTYMWCRKCVEEIGLLVPSPVDKSKTTPPPPTLEGMIRDIISEEMSNHER